MEPSSFETSSSWFVLAIAETAEEEAFTVSAVSSSILDLCCLPSVSSPSATTLRIHGLSLGRNSFCSIHAIPILFYDRVAEPKVSKHAKRSVNEKKTLTNTVALAPKPSKSPAARNAWYQLNLGCARRTTERVAGCTGL
jgi:hypothetical protein